ncbi:MAG: hypothetical protein WCO53_13990 [Deltaproteobacteria bacterium]
MMSGLLGYGWAMANMNMIRFDGRSDLLAPHKAAHYPLCAIKSV